jgi:hypothetical protein
MRDDGRARDREIFCGETCRKISGEIPDGWISMDIADVKKHET